MIPEVTSTINLKKQQSHLLDKKTAFGAANNEQSNSNNRLKSALKFGGSVSLATIASDAIFFNKSWKGKGKVPAIVNSVLDGAGIGAVTALMHYAGFWDDNKTNKTDTVSAPPEEPVSMPDKEDVSTFVGRMKTLGIFGAACYVLSSGIELVANKFNNVGKILGKNALITAGIIGVVGAATEGIKYYKDKKANQK